MKKPDFELNCGYCNKNFLVKRKRYFDQIRKDENCKFYCSKYCRIAKFKTGQIINCIVCEKETYKDLKSLENGGKFCSTSCAAIFNNQLRPIRNKGKVKEINCSLCNKIYIGSIHAPLINAVCDECYEKLKIKQLNCIDCGIIIYGSIGKKYCEKCRNKKRFINIQYKINNGLLFSKSIKCNFLFNNNLVKCDSKLEYVCLWYFTTNYNILNIKRSKTVLQYTINNKVYNYFPDFEITMFDGIKYLIECKGVVGEKLSDKWNNYNLKSIEKKKVLEEWCKLNDYVSFWFDQRKYEKYYKKFKLINGEIILIEER